MATKQCVDCKGTFEDGADVEVCPGCGSRNGWNPEDAAAKEKAQKEASKKSKQQND